MARRLSRGLCGALVAAAMMIMVAACSSPGNAASSATSTTSSAGSSPSAGSGADPAIQKLVPSQFKGKTLSIASITNAPPYEFTSGGQQVGFVTDLIKAMIVLTGLKATYPIEPNALEAIAGIEAGKWQAQVAGFDVTAAREKVVDQITIFEEKYSFLRLKSSPALGTSPADVCGMKVALITQDPSVQYVQTLSKQYCTSAGKPAVQEVLLPDAPSMLLALQSGRVQLVSQVYSYLRYIALESGGSEVVTGFTYAPTLVSMITQKGNGLAQLYKAAINELIANGTYQQILAKYGVSGLAIKAAEINPPPLPVTF
jgi:polar amino acid transport system substrate-binding protein